MKNKLAAIYSVFDSEELLQNSIDCIRDFVEYVVVVYQEISNFGNYHRKDLYQFLKTIKGIDEIVLFVPNLSIYPHQNEINKRAQGCKVSIEKECSHFLHIDCDEMYEPLRFQYAKNKIVNNDYDSSVCVIRDYYKFRNLSVVSQDISYVPFIHKLQPGITKLGINLPYPVSVDNTRKALPNDKFYSFEEEEIIMHHYSWIREEVKIKLLNSTARMSYNHFLDDIVKEYENFCITDNLVKLETGLLIPESLIVRHRDKIPYKYKPVLTKKIFNM